MRFGRQKLATETGREPSGFVRATREQCDKTAHVLEYDDLKNGLWLESLRVRDVAPS